MNTLSKDLSLLREQIETARLILVRKLAARRAGQPVAGQPELISRPTNNRRTK